MLLLTLGLPPAHAPHTLPAWWGSWSVGVWG